MKYLAALALASVAGCQSSSMLREHELEANLPRAQGIGSFQPTCIFFCFSETHFTHGDDTIDPNATQALMRSKLVVEQEKGSSMKPPPSIIKRPKIIHPAIKEHAP